MAQNPSRKHFPELLVTTHRHGFFLVGWTGEVLIKTESLKGFNDGRCPVSEVGVRESDSDVESGKSR